MTTDTGKLSGQRVAGGLLMVTSILAIFLMAHHPTNADGAGPIRAMHGAIMLAMVAQAIGFLLFARSRASGWAVAGMMVFALALVAGLGAGTINGFVVAAMIDAGNTSYAPLLWAANQALAAAGAIATGLAFGLWGIDLWRAGWRIIGASGLITGLATSVLLIAGSLSMNLHGAQLVYAAQALWAAALGAALLRGGWSSEGP